MVMDSITQSILMMMQMASMIGLILMMTTMVSGIISTWIPMMILTRMQALTCQRAHRSLLEQIVTIMTMMVTMPMPMMMASSKQFGIAAR